MKLENWKRAERRSIRNELRQLGKEERQRQDKAVQVGAWVTTCTHPETTEQRMGALSWYSNCVML